MIKQAFAGLDVDPARCLVVGDRLSTDIELALRGGLDSALTLTGDSSLDDLRALPKDRHPTYIVENIDQLMPADAGRKQPTREASNP